MSIEIHTFSPGYLLLDAAFFHHIHILFYRTSINMIAVSQSEQYLILSEQYKFLTSS